MSAPTDPTTGLPANWSIKISSSRNIPYYIFSDPDSPDSRPTTTWDIPDGADRTVLGDYIRQISTGRAGCRHLLLKHTGSRRAVDPDGNPVTRSKQQARDELEILKADIGEDPEKFARLAKEHSECSSRSRGGDLGTFERGQMQEPFEKASFALKVGGFSDIVSTGSGEHLIYRYA